MSDSESQTSGNYVDLACIRTVIAPRFLQKVPSNPTLRAWFRCIRQYKETRQTGATQTIYYEVAEIEKVLIEKKTFFYRMNPTNRLERAKRNFMSHCLLNEANGCLEWIGSKNIQGYGAVCFRWGERTIRGAHRLAWFLFREHRHIPVGLFVLHRCDNRHCVNVDHLFIGTHADNMMDAASKGRMKGAPNNRHSAKLNIEQVNLIRGSSDESSHLAARFNVSNESIKNIRNRLSWK